MLVSGIRPEADARYARTRAVTVAADVDAFIRSSLTVDSASMVAAGVIAGDNVPTGNAGFGVAYISPDEGVLCGLLPQASCFQNGNN